MVKKHIFDQKSQFSENFPKLDCNPEVHRFTEKETILWKTDSLNQGLDRHAHTSAIYTFSTVAIFKGTHTSMHVLKKWTKER